MIFKLGKNEVVNKAYKKLSEALQILCCCNSPYGSVEKQEKVRKLMEKFVEDLENLNK